MSSHHGTRFHSRQATVSVRGWGLASRELGEGTPIVFIHGTMAGMDTFRRQLLWFGQRSRAIAYSRRFHPPSGPVGWPGAGDASGSRTSAGSETTVQQYSLDDHAADLVALVEALGITRPHLVGSSYGAYVAIRACLLEPALASSLVAAEPPMLRLLELTPEGRGALGVFQEKGLDPARQAFDRGDTGGGVAHFFDGIRGEAGAFASLTNLQRSDLLRFGPELQMELTSDLDRYMPPVSPVELGSLKVPTLLLSGGESPPLFHIITRSLLCAIPGSKLITIPRADHSIHTSAPAAYNEAVWEFILSHS